MKKSIKTGIAPYYKVDCKSQNLFWKESERFCRCQIVPLVTSMNDTQKRRTPGDQGRAGKSLRWRHFDSMKLKLSSSILETVDKEKPLAEAAPDRWGFLGAAYGEVSGKGCVKGLCCLKDGSGRRNDLRNRGDCCWRTDPKVFTKLIWRRMPSRWPKWDSFEHETIPQPPSKNSPQGEIW